MLPGEERRSSRISTALPAVVATGERDHSALLVDIAPEGAKVACTAPLAVNSPLTLKCGSIRSAGFVLWGEDGRYGIEFDTPLTPAEIDEQVARADAVTGHRRIKTGS